MENFTFTESDKNKVIEFLNFVAQNATFQVKTDGAIAYVRLLSHMQQVVIPKIEANIFELGKLTKQTPSTEEAPKEAKTRGK